jgi:hypothetical protein
MFCSVDMIKFPHGWPFSFILDDTIIGGEVLK